MNTVVRAESLIHRNLTYLFVDKHIQEDAAFLEGVHEIYLSHLFLRLMLVVSSLPSFVFPILEELPFDF